MVKGRGVVHMPRSICDLYFAINCFDDFIDIQDHVSEFDAFEDEFPGQICMALTMVSIDEKENLEFAVDYHTDIIDYELMTEYKLKKRAKGSGKRMSVGI